MNPYLHLASEYARFATEGKSYQLGGFPDAPRPTVASNAPKVLVFSPHPDDECIVGSLAFRLLREGHLNVINVAVTQGSNKARQAGRLAELQNACQYLGFGLVQTSPNGLERVYPKTREQDPAAWQGMVEIIAKILLEHQPRIILFPHELDWNGTHVGTHFLVMDALRTLGNAIECAIVETEFWGQMASPNLMVESSAQDVADFMTALSFHVGEVQRNPYHILLPAWMLDNVRRGCELVGGQGKAAPNFIFATLYRLRRWSRGSVQDSYAGGKFLPLTTDPTTLFDGN